MADLKMEITPQSIAIICAVRNEEIPQHVIDKLSPAEQEDAKTYNKELILLHWHVQGVDRRGNGKNMSFPTEAEADEFANQVWYWETGGDEDIEYSLDTKKCFEPNCRVYVG
jgi:hypothetical protein